MQQEDTITQQTPPPTEQPRQQPKPPKRPRDRSKNRFGVIGKFLSNFGILIAAPLVALLLINFVFQSYEVDGPSMQNTLQDQDRLVVLKTGKTYADLRNEPYIPKRGAIVIFHKPDSIEAGGSDRQLIKRVMGLPGERVVVRDGAITVYNLENPEGFNPDSGSEYAANIDSLTPGNVDLTVPEGEIFVTGDNRDNSSDSRAFGTVESDDIVGELALRIYPFSSFQSFWK